MKIGFMLFMACAMSAAVAVSHDNGKESNPSASLSPAEEFGASTTSATNKTTTPHANTTTTPFKPNTTTPHANTTTTTIKPNTTTPHANTTTTTIKPNTTTPHANTTTTTIKPNTTTPHANTTTTPFKPNTTTPHANTTTHSPTPAPPVPTPKAKLTTGNYTLTKDKKTCAMANVALRIRVEYGTKIRYEGNFIVQPNKTTLLGSCGSSTVNFNITFTEGFVDFQFLKNATDKSVYVSSIAVGVTYPFEHADQTRYAASNGSVQLFRAAIGHSYSCRSQSVYLGNGIHLEMTDGRMQAFNITKDFGLPDPCPADQPDYRVAIAVGIVLLLLIIIVVVAYLIGRRKRTDGYQSL